MANIKNNHVSALTVGSTTIPAGGVANVKDWEVQKNSHGVKAWLAATVIEEVGGKPAKTADVPVIPPAAPPATPAPAIPGLPGVPPVVPPAGDDQGVDAELAEKNEIIAKLQAHGITKTTKSKLENLRAALAAIENDEAED